MWGRKALLVAGFMFSIIKKTSKWIMACMIIGFLAVMAGGIGWAVIEAIFSHINFWVITIGFICFVAWLESLKISRNDAKDTTAKVAIAAFVFLALFSLYVFLSPSRSGRSYLE